MSFKNTFETQAKEYLGITKDFQVDPGGITIADSCRVARTSGETGLYVEMRADPANQSSQITFGSTIGASAGAFDSRIVSFNVGGVGVTGPNNNLALQTDGNVQILTNLQVGSPTAPGFKLDYSSTPATVGTNQSTTITFTAGLFSIAPTVVATANTPTGETGDQFVHVEEVTASSFKVEYLGVCAAGSFINWIAVGR